MSRQWTKQQHNAIYATDGSVLVSAAAGSGKTAVLVERVIKMITREDCPLDVDRLLIVTFTRAAAAEMRERIALALDSLLDKDPYNAHLLRQKQLLYSANISTIDSFCSNIVREYFHCLDISRDFRIADTSELDILSAQALEIAFEKFYKADNGDFIRLIDAFASKNGDEKLRQTVLKIAEFLSTQPFPNQWLDNMLQNYTQMPVADTIWGKIIINNFLSAIEYAESLTQSSLERIKEDEKLESALSEKLSDDFAFLCTLKQKMNNCSWNETAAFIQSYAPGRLSTPRGYKDNPIKLSVSSNRDEVKSTIKKLQSGFSWNESEIHQEIAELFDLVSTLFELVKSYMEEYAELKNKKNILSFADIESLAVKLLAAPDDENGYIKTTQAEEISNRFDAVMVDEFQDVNDIQDLIFKCVSKNEENLFVVGDVKQSIYGFRQAKPEIFINRKNQYNKFNSDEPNYPVTIILDKNFRSRREVCNAVNFIFKNLMTEDTAKMDYTEEEYLNVGAIYPPSADCSFEIALIEKNSFDGYDSDEIEAYYIADKIHKMIADGYQIAESGIMRPATYGDFAVIMRSPGTKAMKYVNTLISCGIPAYSETKESFFDALEIKIMLNLLRVIDNPTLDIPLLSVMCSPIYGFTPDELAILRADNRRTSLYFAVKQYAKINPKAEQFIKELDSMREFSYICSVDELISHIYELTSFKAISLAVSGNELTVKNLNLLRDYARTYEANGYKALSDFISFIDKLVANGTSLSASVMGEGTDINSVRVLSIHASKGLEYPVCFIADTAHQFNKSDLKSDILIDSHAGLGIRKKSGLLKYGTFPHFAVGIELEENEIAEELRVLYVALTRAKEKLIVVSSQRDTDKYLNKLYSKLTLDRYIMPYSVSGCSSISDWICLCALAHPSLNALKQQMIPSALMLEHNDDLLDWNFNIITSENFKFELFDVSARQFSSDSVDFAPDNFDYAKLLQKNLDFKYINSDILNLPQKVTASNIAHEQNNDYFEKILSKPSFIKDEASSSVERGTAHHKLLQFCDFKSAQNNIDDEIARLVSLNILTQDQADCIDKAAVSEFFKSNLMQRIINSPLVMREERFTAKLKPSLVFDEYRDITTDKKVIIQGAVDLAFEEKGELVIVDYKTDRVGDIQKLKFLYSKQLMLYKEALEQSAEMTVKECILYSVHLNEYITI